MADDYLARLGIDTGDLRSAIDQTITLLGQLEDHFGSKLAGAVAKSTAAFEKVAGVQRDSAASSKAAGEAVAREATEFGKLLKVLDEARQAYSTFRKEELTGEGGGKSVTEYSIQELRDLIAISEAANASFVTDAKRRVSEVETAEQEQAEYQEEQIAAVVRAAREGAAARTQAEKETTTAILAQAKERQAAFEREQELYNTPTSNRYGPADYSNVRSNVTANSRNSARLNVAAPGAAAAAQEEYDAQASTALRSYYTELERTSASTEKLTKKTVESSTSLPRLRYAMYDVSIFAGILGGALTAGGVAIERTAIQYQAAFASVARTAHTTGTQVQQDSQLKSLRSDLEGLSQQIPVTFADITKIATLGNQLNIPANDLTNFTKTVAQFSASTDVSVEASATAFGRLGQVFHDTNYRQVGDEIAYLGVNAVATESQIIKVSQQIAVSGQAYGFTEQQTLALATAYASLGVQAESARGTTVRSFSEISLAVANGGSKLAELAQVSGMSTKDFQKAWRDDASGAFTAFVKGLSTYGGNAKQVLADLGITASRDTTNLLLLAQNSNVLTKAQKDVTESGGALNRMFEKQTDTVQARLTLAQNNVNAIFADIGQSTEGPVRGALDALNSLLRILDDIAKNPIAAGGAALAVGLTTIVGALLLGVAAWTQFRANLLAVATVQEALGPQTTGLSSIYQILFGSLTRTRTATTELAAADAELAGAQTAVAETGTAESLSQSAGAAASAEGAMGKLSSAGGKLSGVLGKAGMVGAALALVAVAPSLITALADIGDQMSGTQKDASELEQTILGLADKRANKQSKGTLATATDYLTTRTQYATHGEINNPQDPEFRGGYVSNARALYNQRTTGQTIPGKSVGIAQGGFQINYNVGEADKQAKSLDTAMSSLVQGGHVKEAKAEFEAFTATLSKNDRTSKLLAVLFPQLSQALGVTKGQTIQAALAGDKATSSADRQKAAYSQIISSALSVGSSQTAVQKSLSGLGKSFVTNGIQATIYGGSLKTTISNILAEAGSGPAAASQMQTLFETLVKGGYASAAQLAPLQKIILALNNGSKASAAAVPGLDSLSAGYNKAAAAANKQAEAAANSADQTQKDVRTLMDYSNDLSSVFSNAIEYRNGQQVALDAVSSKWNDLRQREKDATDQLKQYRTQLDQLKQQRADDQFYLGIANRYGDTRRAADLSVNIATTNSQIADTQKSVNKAQTDSSKALKGQSAAAIQNRSDLYGLIDAHKDYIAKLAESGASQATINTAIAKSKQQFIDQAIQMGFNKRDVDNLAASFDDFRQIVAHIPRAITTKVDANTSAAMKAIKDYEAAAKNMSGKTYGGGTYIPLKVQKPTKASADAAKAASLIGDIEALSAELASPDRPKNSYVLSQIAAQLSSYRGQLANLGGFAGGGYTGDLPTNAVAGVVHGREYVLNATGAQMFPREMLDAANQGRAPYMAGRGGMKMVMPEHLTVSLSQLDRMLLGQNPAVQVGISPDRFGSAIDAAFVRAGQLGSN